MQKSGSSGVIYRFDIEKAQDHANMTFLLGILDKMGFGEKWIG